MTNMMLHSRRVICLARHRLLIAAGTRLLLLVAAAIGLQFGVTPQTSAQDVISQEEPTPSSVDEIATPIDRSFIERIPKPGVFPWLKEQLKDAPPFFRD